LIPSWLVAWGMRHAIACPHRFLWNRPSLRLKREAHLNRQGNRNIAQLTITAGD